MSTTDRESIEALRDATRDMLRKVSANEASEEEVRAYAQRITAFERAGGFAMWVICRRCHARYPLVAASSAVMRTLYQERCLGCTRDRSLEEPRDARMVRSSRERMHGK